MYKTSEGYASQITADNRKFTLKLTFGSTVLTGSTISDIALEEITNSGDTLTMGSACSNKITVNLINPPRDIDYDGTSFTADIGLIVNGAVEYVPLGKFYATEPTTNNDFKTLQLVAYDGFCKMTGKYNATVPSNTTLQAIYNDLKEQLYSKCGVTLKARTVPTYSITNFPYLDITYTQAISYVAGCLGGFARFDRNGELEINWYSETGLEIPRKLQYMNGFTRTTDKSLTVTSIATGTKEKPIVVGDGANGTQINFENPYITEAMAADIYTKVNGLAYTPCTVKWRGNPALQSGDIVTVYDKDDVPHTVLVMGQSVKVGGGLNASIDCKGKGATRSEFTNRFESVGQKIERIYSTLEQQILEATNAITGNRGGYVMLHDTNSDGKPDELLIVDIEDIAAATKVWRWNKEGLGYAENPNGNAYSGPYRTAITADGKINADFITTGTLSANLISVESYDGNGMLTDYIHFGDGYMTFGESANALTLRLENDQVAFYTGTTRIAYFSNNSFEIENLQEGKIRFQNFGFVTRASGNLTFTKLK